MKKLSTEEALKLMEILSPYIPDEFIDGLDFIGKIVNNIKETNPIDYVKALSIILEGSIQDVLDVISPEESITIFAEGLAENDIIDLKKFYERLTNG